MVGIVVTDKCLFIISFEITLGTVKFIFTLVLVSDKYCLRELSQEKLLFLHLPRLQTIGVPSL